MSFTAVQFVVNEKQVVGTVELKEGTTVDINRLVQTRVERQ